MKHTMVVAPVRGDHLGFFFFKRWDVVEVKNILPETDAELRLENIYSGSLDCLPA